MIHSRFSLYLIIIIIIIIILLCIALFNDPYSDGDINKDEKGDDNQGGQTEDSTTENKVEARWSVK